MTISSIPANVKSLKTARILIVEDEYILARNLKEGLESFGYTVVGIVDSGEAAIEHAIALSPNIILMDIRIRGEMDGIQAAEQIWQHLKIPIIYVTGHSDQSTVERATLTFPFGYILKPVRDKELYVVIQTTLSRYEHEQFFSTVLQGMGDGVIVADPQLHIKYLNPAAETLTGWKLDEAKEQIITDTVPFLNEHNQLPINHPILSALEEEETIFLSNDVLLRRKDGTILPVADSAALLRNNDGTVTGAVLVFRDDTQRRLAEERDRANERTQQTEIQLAEQQRLNQLKDDFLATTSHELRTPLSNIKLAIYMLETALNQQGVLHNEDASSPQAVSRQSSLSESINRYITLLREQCDQELKLINDLLDMRSLEAGVCPLELATIQLQEWLPHIAESFQERTESQQQKLRVSVSPEIPPIVSDRASLTRIVSELLNNACKYTPAGEAIEVSADLFPDVPNPVLQIVVRNSGIEIPSDQLSQIFEPFYRIPNNDPWRYGGTGLGLALTKKLLAQLQGTIDSASTQGWTTFTVRLPLSIAK